MRVLYFKAYDVAGLRELEVAPGKLTEIVGDNGTGKTSTLKALTNALMGRESLAQLARLAPNEAGDWVPTGNPRIVMLIGNPGEPHKYELDKTITGPTVKERVGDSKAFKVVKKPQTLLDSLYDGRAANPVPIITLAELGREKELAALILETLPLERDEERLAAILGDRIHLVSGRDMLAKLHPIEEIQLTRDAIFSARTGVNTSESAKRQTADDLLRSIPAYEDASGVTERLAAARAALAEARDARTAMNAEAETAEERRTRAAEEAYEAARREATSLKLAALADLKKEYDRAVRAEEEAFEKAVAAATHALAQSRLASAEAREAEQLDLANARRTVETATATVAQLEKEAQQVIENAALEKRAQQAKKEAEALQAESKKLTAIMAALDDFSRSLSEKIPIPGLVIKPGKITLNGIPIHQQNTAELAKFAVRVSVLRTAGTLLPWVAVDGIELLGKDAFEALKKELEAVPDIQVFMARVDDNKIVEIRSGNEIVGEAKL